MLTLIAWLRQFSSGFSTVNVKLLFYPLFYTIFFYILLIVSYYLSVFFSNEHDYFDNWDRGAIFILEKIDKVSRDICPFFMFCLGLVSTLLHTTPPVVSVGNLSGH